MLEFTRNIIACDLQLLIKKTANYGLLLFIVEKKKIISEGLFQCLVYSGATSSSGCMVLSVH